MNNITLGQFFPGNTILHRIDPRLKLFLAIAYIVALFLAKGFISYVFVIVLLITMIIISKIPFIVVLRNLKPIIFIIVITIVVNVFLYSGNHGDPIVTFWKIKIYQEGIANAIYMVVRIVCMIIGTSVILTYTTSPIAITDGLEQILAPLSKIKLPVHEFSMMMTIALRFVPTIIEETTKITQAQKARGANLSSGNIIKRAKAFIPILIPLFVSSFKRADELATAMECRCYRGGKGRTKMNVLKFKLIDLFGFLFASFFIAAVVVLNIYFPILVV